MDVNTFWLDIIYENLTLVLERTLLAGSNESDSLGDVTLSVGVLGGPNKKSKFWKQKTKIRIQRYCFYFKNLFTVFEASLDNALP